MSEDWPPEPSKLTLSKRRWASEGKFLTGAPAGGEEQRLPPGQHLVRDWPILDLGRQPDIPRDRWRLAITGLVETPFTLDWHGLSSLAQSESRSDIHCVTSWSRYDNDWAGVATMTLLDAVQPLEEATAVLLHGSDGYTTNLTVEDFAATGVLLAHTWQGRALERQHGGPVRLVVPHLYFWKSAKWISAIEFRSVDGPGYWEANGYHLRGDPWTEERYS